MRQLHIWVHRLRFSPVAVLNSGLHHPTFAALHNASFRWLWFGGLASSANFQVSSVAQGWLVYELTGSAFALSWVSSGSSIATLLFSLYGGVVCDRVDKRRLLIWCRLCMMMISLVTALLISTGLIRLWHLALSALLSGLIFSFTMPAQQTMTSDLVDRQTLLNAISLNSVGMGLMGIVAAGGAGLLIQLVGPAGGYYIMAVLQLIALFAMTKLPSTSAGCATTSSIWRDLVEGVRYITAQSAILVLLVLNLARVVFAMPYRTFMPKFAVEVLGFEAAGLGLLTAAPGVGSLISSLAVASRGDYRGKGKLFLASGVVLGLSLILFVNVRSLALVLFFLGLVGATGNICMVANQALLQLNASDRFRGRVMSVYMMLWGLTPLGTIPGGVIADRMGVPFVVGLQGVVVLAAFLIFWLFRKEVRQLE